MIDVEEAKRRIGDEVVSTFPDTKGDIGVITHVNRYGIIFVKFARRPVHGTTAENLRWRSSGGEAA